MGFSLERTVISSSEFFLFSLSRRIMEFGDRRIFLSFLKKFEDIGPGDWSPGKNCLNQD
jgi:hypothetical protein